MSISGPWLLRAGTTSILCIVKQYLPFVPRVFLKVLAVTLTVVLIGYVVAYAIYGELKSVDIVGSLISAPLFAYLVHLWITMGKEW